ncbi:MAG: glycosyltransferase [Bacteroidota bacterium]
MKTLHIIPNLRKGGAERLVSDIVRELSTREGIEVRLVIFRNEIAYDIEDILHLVHIIPSSVQLSIWRKNKYNNTDLQRFIENFQPDIIHSHLFEAEINSRSCYYPKAKWFSHSHNRMKSLRKLNFKALFSKNRLTDYYERKYLLSRYKKNGGNHVIAISKDIKAFLKSTLPHNIVKINKLENAIDSNRFKRPRLIEEKVLFHPIKLISIGRLDTNKNHQFLLDCIFNLKNRGFQFHLSIVGEGETRPQLEQKINDLELHSEVTLAGVKDNVEEFLWQSDLYVHSALAEGFGLTLIEAMASGLPVITIDGGGNRDLIEEGKNGFLIEKENVNLFVEKILELKNNPALYQNMSQYAKTYAQKFDIVPYVDNLLELYKKASSCAE